ncbi:zinc-binding dehydrogenase [Cnuibacter sp. UC19_7]|uniref:zinc-binding dehydrogenase n=1 Tax=Cnuibacter sp. UC19_7 TaxID=3350166 RepID=UPI00366AF702
MRAITIETFGDPSGMKVVDLPDPAPSPGQVLIRTEAIGVAGVDAVIRRGTLGSGYPVGMIPGGEAAGIVTATGEGVDRELIGSRVWAFMGTGGAYAELALAQATDVTPIPEGLSSADAVTLGSASAVAHFALAQAHAARGASVLVRGAAGSLGIATVELAAQRGASAVAVTTSSADRGRRLRHLGATHVLDRAGAGDDDAPTSFDVIIDIVGGADIPAFIDRLAPNGRMVLVGAVAGFPPPDFGMALMRSFQKSRSFGVFSLASIPPSDRDAVRRDHFDAVTRGDLHAVIHDILPLDEAAEAHRLMDAGSVFGRIVLTV